MWERMSFFHLRKVPMFILDKTHLKKKKEERGGGKERKKKKDIESKREMDEKN